MLFDTVKWNGMNLFEEENRSRRIHSKGDKQKHI
jgi:hypothetical protein